MFAGAVPPKALFLIFLNNVQVALACAAPFLGPIELAVSTYNTGRVVQVIAIQDQVSPYSLLQSLYSLPHTWLETSCYAIAAGLGVYITIKALYARSNPSFSDGLGNRRVRPFTQLSIGFAKVAGLLFMAATFEVAEPYLGTGEYLLWIPVLAFVIWYLRRQFGEAKNRCDGLLGRTNVTLSY